MESVVKKVSSKRLNANGKKKFNKELISRKGLSNILQDGKNSKVVLPESVSSHLHRTFKPSSPIPAIRD